MLKNAYLRTLPQLDKSTLQFPDQLCDALGGKEFDEKTSTLQTDDLMEVIDYLDKVWSLYRLDCHPLNPL